MGEVAVGLIGEIDVALRNCPRLIFDMPDLRTIDIVQRDLGRKQLAVKKIREQYLRKLKDEGFTEDEALGLLEEGDGSSHGR